MLPLSFDWTKSGSVAAALQILAGCAGSKFNPAGILPLVKSSLPTFS